MHTHRIEIKRIRDESYDIEAGFNLMGSLVQELHAQNGRGWSRCIAITDSTVADLYARKICKRLKDVGVDTELLIFEAGEKNKTRATKEKLEDMMIARGVKRDALVLAIGGGVVSDMAGFLAGTYARGVPYCVYSTTLLAAADASVGGKTAVDTPAATNLIGLFHQPQKVYIDIETWKTLPPREIAAGMAETVKHACLASAAFFDFLEDNAALLQPNTVRNETRALYKHIAHENIRIKTAVVSADPNERNYRQVLNLGHTIGRALETLCGYRLLHGECVSIGLVLQAEIGQRLGTISPHAVARVRALLAALNLPTTLPPEIETVALVQKMHTDKKGIGGTLKMVFQKEIGDMMQFEGGAFARTMGEDTLVAMIEEIRSL